MGLPQGLVAGRSALGPSLRPAAPPHACSAATGVIAGRQRGLGSLPVSTGRLDTTIIAGEHLYFGHVPIV